MNQEGKRVWARIEEEALLHNLKVLQSALPAGCKLMPAVKGDAYGHGAVKIARRLEGEKIHSFCVASLEEGVELRQAGVRGDILILGYTLPKEAGEVLEHNLIQTVVDADYAKELNACMQERGSGRLRVHVGIDTGMHRLGEWFENIDRIAGIWDLSRLTPEGVYSHLCAADGRKGWEIEVTKRQIDRFDRLTRELYARGIGGFSRHLQNSGGILNYPSCRYEYARPGIALYGAGGLGEGRLRPVLTLKSRIACVRELRAGEGAGYGLAFTAKKDGRIAVVCAGYGDGLPRSLSGKGWVLCRGRRARIAGRICMDQMLVDVTDIPQAKPGDEVVFIGSSGKEVITAEELANLSGTISNEILCRLSRRVERIYTGSLSGK